MVAHYPINQPKFYDPRRTLEPSIKKSFCSYCGDAPVNHTVSYLESLISVSLDSHINKVARVAPDFIKKFADWLPVFIFKSFAFLGLAELSDDINKANTFRSRIIWEEAKKRGIKMKQLVIWGRPLDYYHAEINGQAIYFESIPIPSKFLEMRKSWDDKAVLKKEFSKNNIPVPFHFKLQFFNLRKIENIFSEFKKPIIVKPQVGSRSRHTVTNIKTLEQFRQAVRITRQISSYLVVEEHLYGDVCRATLVGGILAGFYRARAPFVVGDGEKTIGELIEEKDKKRPERVERVRINEELDEHIARAGFVINDVLPAGIHLSLSHRRGRFFGGTTKEMIDELHPSFISVLEKATVIVDLAVVGFDCIIPDPTKPADSQKWGIIECNTLPFIDLHYYALEGKPRNIAGMIWDLWK